MKPTHGPLLNREEKRVVRRLLDFLRECFPFEITLSGGQLRFEFSPKFTPEFRERVAQVMAERMVTGVLVANAKTWRAAASESSQGQRIYEALGREQRSGVGRRAEELIASHQKLIEAIPDQLNKRAQKFVAREQQRGRRAEQIAEDLKKKLPTLTRSQAALYARTEVSRADTAITQARAEALDLAWYEWNTSRDARVRPSHRLMERVLVNWNDPPAPEALDGIKSNLGRYHAGCTYNCRCLALPLVSADEVSWPHRVYLGGEIVRLTRAQFARLAGVKRAA